MLKALAFVFFAACTPHTLEGESSNPGAGGTNDTAVVTDDTVTDTDTETPVTVDADGDGYAATNGDGAVVDCNDGDATINPAADDASCDGVDQDCDGVDGNDAAPPPPSTGSECGGVDEDGDGYMSVDASGNVVDCDDADATVYPGATEILDDGIDQDCNGTDAVSDTGDTGVVSTDADGDGFADTDDCDDASASVHPGATEIAYDGIDQDCDGSDLVDVDCDGYAAVDSSGNVVDCDDADDSVYPGAAEVSDDGIDQDCDGIDLVVTETDADSDGYGLSSDCDDGDASVHPGAAETCNGLDDDCDGTLDEGVTIRQYLDQDGDGWGDELTGEDTCAIEAGHVDSSQVGDCNTLDASIYPGAPEVLDDGIDQDCDEQDSVTPPADADGDGYAADVDCDDGDASINPGADEEFDLVDNDCNDLVDDATGIEAYVAVTYPSSNYYSINAQVYWDVSDLGAAWDESATQASGTTVDVEFTTDEYGDLTGSCGVRFNVSEGSPARDWLCVGGAVENNVEIDVFYDGAWYDEDDVEAWIVDEASGSCSAILVASSAADCQI